GAPQSGAGQAKRPRAPPRPRPPAPHPPPGRQPPPPPPQPPPRLTPEPGPGRCSKAKKAWKWTRCQRADNGAAPAGTPAGAARTRGSVVFGMQQKGAGALGDLLVQHEGDPGHEEHRERQHRQPDPPVPPGLLPLRLPPLHSGPP